MGKHYTPEQDAIIKDKYPKIGIGVAELIPEHDEKSIIYRAKRLGCHVNANHTRGENWSEEELEVMRNNFSKMGTEIVCLLPNRTLQAIMNKAQHMGIRSPSYNTTKSDHNESSIEEWSKAEDRIIIKTCYDYMENKLVYSDDLLDLLPNRDESSIRLRVANLAKYRNGILGGYPINVYITIMGSHKNYCRVNLIFADLVESAFVAIKTNSDNPKIAEKIVEALELHYKFGMDVTDIAEELNIKEDSAKWLLNTGAKFMRQALLKK